MQRYTGVERRRFVRIPFWFVTNYRVYPYEAGAANKFRQGTGKNIGVGGICFETEDSFGVGTVLEIEMDMPALDHGVCVIGQIVWTHTPGEGERYVYGIAFTKIQPEDVEAVKKIVEAFS